MIPAPECLSAETNEEAEARFRSLVEDLSDLLYTLDIKGIVTYVSEAIERISSYTAAEVIGRHHSEFIHPEDLPLFRGRLQRAPLNEVESREYRIVDKSGAPRWVRSSSRIRLKHGQPVGVIGLITDIAEQRRTEQLRAGESCVLEMIATNAPLKETLAALCTLIEAQASGMICSVLLLDEDGLHMRHGAAPNLPSGYTKVIDGLTIGACAGSCGTAMYRGEPVIVTDILTDPLWAIYRDLATQYDLRACWSIPVRSHQGKVLGSLAMYYREPRSPRDAEMKLLQSATHIAGIAIQRHRSEESLRRAEQKYRSIFEDAVEGICQSTPKGRFITVNPALARMLGYASPEDLCTSIHDIARQLYVDPERRREYEQQLHERSMVQGFECQFFRKDSSKIWVSLSTRAVRDHINGSLHFEGTVEEITERKRLEEQFRQAQKMDAVGQLAGGVAHDFNNLLTVILGCSDLLLHRTKPSDSAYALLGEIHQAGQRAASLTRQLLAFSRKQVLAPQILDLSKLVAETEKMLRRLIGEHIVFHCKLSSKLGQVKADPGQIEQVIMNLVVNARDAMQRGGELAIETDNVELGEDFIKEQPEAKPGSYVRLTVRDTGCGMSPEVMAHLFEPFFTTKERGKGTGLGLATVYGIVNQSDGHVQVRSEVGRGTTINIFLPKLTEVPAWKAARMLTPPPLGGMETILLVEDEEPVRRLIAWVLESTGYTVLQAANAADALRATERLPGAIHLLLTDVVMPGLSGPELADKFLAVRPGVKVLYCTGYTDGTSAAQVGVSAGTSLLHKPFTPGTLARKVREVLDQI
jgi:two-component system cell cycle sensor histidine kinase/response regulator CckA